MLLLAFKTLHIIGFTAWFAGLFYLVRMFVYHTEAYTEEEPKRSIFLERYAVMENRVYKIICNPALTITWIAGLAMIYLYGWEWFRQSTWLHIKLGLLSLLTIYHFSCGRLMRRIKQSPPSISSFQFRLYNEVPTLFLVAIVILAVFKTLADATVIFAIVVSIGLLLFLLAKAYGRWRISTERKYL